MQFLFGTNAKSTALEATRNETLIRCPLSVVASLDGCMEPSQPMYFEVEVLQNSADDLAGILHQPILRQIIISTLLIKLEYQEPGVS